MDYPHLIEEPGTTDLILADPDYVPSGGHETSTIPDDHDRYGMRSVGWELLRGPRSRGQGPSSAAPRHGSPAG